MNKIVLLFMVMVFVPLSGFCQRVKRVGKTPGQKIEILSGNPKYYKNAKRYHLEFDYSDLKVGTYADEQSYIDYMKDDAERRKKNSSEWEKNWYGNRKEIYQPKFMDLFNLSSLNGIDVDTIFRNQKYEMNIHTKFIEIGFNKNFETLQTYINVIVTISEQNSPEKPLIISMSYIKGKEAFNSYSPDYRRIEEAYGKCGKELAQFMNAKIYF